MAMMREGVTEEEALRKIWLVDSRGLIVKNRPSGGITEHKVRFAQDHEPIDTLAEVVQTLKPTVLIGAAAIGGAFTKEILTAMASFNDRPVIFALSNPTSKAECTAEEAYTATNVIEYLLIKKKMINVSLINPYLYLISGSLYICKRFTIRSRDT